MTFYYLKDVSERFADVGKDSAIYYQDKRSGRTVQGCFLENSCLEMEDETFANNDPLIAGIPINNKLDGAAIVTDMGRPTNGTEQAEVWFLGNSTMTRAEARSFPGPIHEVDHRAIQVRGDYNMIPISDEVMNVLSQRLKLGEGALPNIRVEVDRLAFIPDGQKSSGIS
ncbi:hypothetical protein Q0F98_02230 [Paenibacillus amylolyticus]|nr:hypothetical protein Q0F98_02230 [Paenibacillus amylolyticus]